MPKAKRGGSDFEEEFLDESGSEVDLVSEGEGYEEKPKTKKRPAKAKTSPAPAKKAATKGW